MEKSLMKSQISSEKVDKEIQRIKDMGRTLSEKDVYEVIQHAETMRSLDELKKSKKELLPITKSLEGKVTVPALYDIANKIGIPEKYIEKALDTYHPSAEKQLEILERNGAKPSWKVVFSEYKENLIKSLKSELPEKDFIIIVTSSVFVDEMHIYEKIRKNEKGFFPWSKPEITIINELWGEVRPKVDGEYLNLQIKTYNALFLPSCETTLKDLNKKFSKYFEVKEDIKWTYKIE